MSTLFDFGSSWLQLGQVSRRAVVQGRLVSRDLDAQLRDLRGRFVSGIQPAFVAANQELAYSVAERMAEALDAAMRGNVREGWADTDRPRLVLRPGKTQEARLREVLLHERNTYADAFRFAAGIPEWLNESPARAYWQRLEEGGDNPSRLITFSSGGGPRYTTQRTRRTVEPAPIPAYRYLARGAERGRAAIKQRAAQEYIRAARQIGVSLLVP